MSIEVYLILTKADFRTCWPPNVSSYHYFSQDMDEASTYKGFLFLQHVDLLLSFLFMSSIKLPCSPLSFPSSLCHSFDGRPPFPADALLSYLHPGCVHSRWWPVINKYVYIYTCIHRFLPTICKVYIVYIYIYTHIHTFSSPSTSSKQGASCFLHISL